MCLHPHRSIAIQASTTGRPFPRRGKPSQLPPARCANQPAFSSSLRKAEPKAKGLHTANWGRRIGHLFKTMSWFDHSSNKECFRCASHLLGTSPGNVFRAPARKLCMAANSFVRVTCSFVLTCSTHVRYTSASLSHVFWVVRVVACWEIVEGVDSGVV